MGKSKKTVQQVARDNFDTLTKRLESLSQAVHLYAPLQHVSHGFKPLYTSWRERSTKFPKDLEHEARSFASIYSRLDDLRNAHVDINVFMDDFYMLPEKSLRSIYSGTSGARVNDDRLHPTSAVEPVFAIALSKDALPLEDVTAKYSAAFAFISPRDFHGEEVLPAAPVFANYVRDAAKTEGQFKEGFPLDTTSLDSNVRALRTQGVDEQQLSSTFQNSCFDPRVSILRMAMEYVQQNKDKPSFADLTPKQWADAFLTRTAQQRNRVHNLQKLEQELVRAHDALQAALAGYGPVRSWVPGKSVDALITRFGLEAGLDGQAINGVIRDYERFNSYNAKKKPERQLEIRTDKDRVTLAYALLNADGGEAMKEFGVSALQVRQVQRLTNDLLWLNQPYDAEVLRALNGLGDTYRNQLQQIESAQRAVDGDDWLEKCKADIFTKGGGLRTAHGREIKRYGVAGAADTARKDYEYALPSSDMHEHLDASGDLFAVDIHFLDNFLPAQLKVAPRVNMRNVLESLENRAYVSRKIMSGGGFGQQNFWYITSQGRAILNEFPPTYSTDPAKK